MTVYIMRRLVWTIAVVLVVLLLSFLVFFKLPAGDPALRFAGKTPTPQRIAEIRHRMGFDKPIYVQFGEFTKHFVTGDEYGWPGLGYDWSRNESVLPEVTSAVPRTLSLIAGASVIWLV